MDTVSNMIIQVKNAGNAGHDTVSVPYSKLNNSIASILKKEGFIEDLEAKTVKGKKVLEIKISFEDARLSTGKPVPKIKGIQRISKPSKRVYRKSSDIKPVKSGYGSLIISTPLGIMSGKDAKNGNLGGEALFNIW